MCFDDINDIYLSKSIQPIITKCDPEKNRPDLDYLAFDAREGLKLEVKTQKTSGKF